MSSKDFRRKPKIKRKTLSGLPEKELESRVPECETTSTKTATTENEKFLYPCQYCSKIFPQKLGNASHERKCIKRTDSNLLLKTNVEAEQREPKNNENDVSIYDYNEEDESGDGNLKENNESLNNRQCKHCRTLFDNPLDLLRHTRDCHHFPRTILPPDEIEKYFDYPNRHFCPICEKPIKTRNFRSVFIKHLLVHTAGLTHECAVCKKKFRRRDHMRAHEKRHIVTV